jgi:WD40 repeat protein
VYRTLVTQSLFLETEMPMSFPRSPQPALLCSLVLLLFPAVVASQSAPSKSGPPSGPKVESAGALPPGAVLRLGSTRFRHSGGVRFVGYSGDGSLLLTADAKALRFWDARTGKELRTVAIKSRPSRGFMGQSAPPAVLSGDGKTVVVGFDTGECTVLDVATGKELRKFKVQVPQNNNFPGNSNPAPLLTRDGRLLIAAEGNNNFGPGGGSSKLRVWDTTTGKELRELTPKDKGSSFMAVALSDDGRMLLTAEGPNPNMKMGGKDEPAARLRYLNPRTGTELQSFTPPTSGITVLRASPDGKTLAAAAQDNQGVRLLEMATSKERGRLPTKQNPHDLIFSPDGKTLFAVGATEVTQWDLAKGKEVRQIPLSSDQASGAMMRGFGRTEGPPVALSPDGRTLALPTPAAVVLWDVPSSKELPGGEGHRNRIAFVTFAPGGKHVLTGSADGALYLWDAKTGRRVREFVLKAQGPGPGAGMGREMFDVLHVSGQFAPDGKSIAGLWPGGKVQVWDVSGKLRFEVGAGQGHTSFTYSPDGRFLATNGSGGSVHVWDAATGRQVRQFDWMPKDAPAQPLGGVQVEMGAYTAAFSPDGRVLLSGAMLIQPNGLRVLVQGWEMASGKERLHYNTDMTFNDGGPQSIEAIFRALDAFVLAFVFSPDGRQLAEANFSSVRLRDLASGRELRVFGGREVTPRTAVFSPDGKLLVAGQQDGTIRLWDLATATVLADLPAHGSAVTALAFSPDGKMLASGARDTTLLLWDWAQLRRQAQAPKGAPAPAARDALWADLAGDNAARAYEAIKALAASPDETVALFKARLQPVAAVDSAHLKKLLDDLDHQQFARRQEAEKELVKLGEVAAKAIKDRLAAERSPEMKPRLEKLLAKVESETLAPTVLQALRAIEVLELIGTPAARQVLQRLAGGAAGHRVTVEARSTLARLNKQAR